MLDPKRPLFIATGRFICALHPTTGKELWRTKLPRVTNAIISLLFSDGRLFAGSGGNVYGINPSTGAILWNNELPGTGYHAVLMTREGADSDQEAAVTAVLAAQAAASSGDGGAAAASTG